MILKAVEVAKAFGIAVELVVPFVVVLYEFVSLVKTVTISVDVQI